MFPPSSDQSVLLVRSSLIPVIRFHDHNPSVFATECRSIGPYDLLCSNRNLDLNTGLDIDDDLLDHLSRRIEIDQPLVNSHLKHIPRLAALAAGCLSGRDLQSFGGETDGALDAQVLRLGALEELGAHFLQGGDFAAGQSDTDLVDFLRRF
jgi:hypothetical protein